MKKRNPKFLDFSHKSLNKKSRNFRHEISHLTSDLLSVDRKINKNLFICIGTIKVLGSEKQTYRITFSETQNDEFHELLYNIENFIFRIHAYRDKICMFINLVMKLGYSESDIGLIEKLLRHEHVMKIHIDTELKKFSSETFAELLKTRKSMSHQIYYDRYDPYFRPTEDQNEIGLYKSAKAWQVKISKEVNKVNDCMELVFQINTHLASKLLLYLNK